MLRKMCRAVLMQRSRSAAIVFFRCIFVGRFWSRVPFVPVGCLSREHKTGPCIVAQVTDAYPCCSRVRVEAQRRIIRRSLHFSPYAVSTVKQLFSLNNKQKQKEKNIYTYTPILFVISPRISADGIGRRRRRRCRPDVCTKPHRQRTRGNDRAVPTTVRCARETHLTIHCECVRRIFCFCFTQSFSPLVRRDDVLNSLRTP